MSQFRELLDTPILKRPLAVILLTPILAVVSLVWHCTAAIRRRQFQNARLPSQSQLIVVGNVVLGGSGKTPIVKYLARTFLKSGTECVLVSRGYGSTQEIQLPSAEMNRLDIHALSDENAEIYFDIISHLESPVFGFLQQRNRREALEKWTKPALFLSDDGLQSLDYVDAVKLCLWPVEVVAKAPPFAAPLGPYREGFGGLKHALERYTYNVWTRVAENVDLEVFKDRIRKATEQFHYEPSLKRDWICKYCVQLQRVHATEKGFFLEPEKLEFGASGKTCSILTAIAHPQKLLEDVIALTGYTTDSYFLWGQEDHANHLPEKVLVGAARSSLCVTTTKDLYRPSWRKYWKTLLPQLPIYVLDLQAHVVDWNGNEVDLLLLKDSQRDLR